jgi:Amt family ammonium transporter
MFSLGFGFNPGSALLLSGEVGQMAANAAVSTALAGSAGGISALFTNLFMEERRTGEPHFSLVMAMNGSLSGLVAITASCAIVEPWAALVIGVVAGWVFMWSSEWLIKHQIDDAVDAIPVHMFNGIWGLLATGIFASPEKMELTYGVSKHVGIVYSWARGSSDATLLACQTLAALFIVGWTMVTVFPFFIWLNYKGWLRSDSLEELVGLDISYHGGGMNHEKAEVKKEFVEAYRRHKSSDPKD